VFPGSAEAIHSMKTSRIPIGCPGNDSQINNCQQCLTKPMTATLIDENIPADDA
jgi:hypothetical protein